MRVVYFLIFVLFVFFSCKQKKKNESQINRVSYLQTTILYDYDLVDKKAEELRFMRNEIFARNGYIFKSKDLRDYFSAKAWYEPRSKDVSDMLSDIEKANIRLIHKHEKQIADRPYQRDVSPGNTDHWFYWVNNKGSIIVDDFNISLISVYKFPPEQELKFDSSYYLIDHLLISTEKEYPLYSSKIVSYDSLKMSFISSLEYIEPCGEMDISNVDVVELPMFKVGVKTIRLMKPECSNYSINMFIEFENGIFNLKFETFHFGWNEKLEFTKSDDSTYFVFVTRRDGIVGSFQNDYKYIYNKNSGELSFETPEVQVIHWMSKVLVKLNVYDNQNAARVDESEHLSFELVPGDMIYLDSVYWKPGVIKIIKGEDSVGYMNVKNLNYQTITTNPAG